MKRTILSLIAALVLGFGLTSCEHQTMSSKEVIVPGSAWQISQPVQGAPFLYCDVAWSELTGDVVDYGTVNVYLMQGSVQNPLPLVAPLAYYDVEWYEGDSLVHYDRYVVNENIRFQLSYGMVRLIIQWDDYALPLDYDNIEDLHFRFIALGD